MTALVCVSQPSIADEGGVSFWLPGIYGSLAAAPQQPGWSLATIYYHTSVSAFGNTAAAREATIGRFSPTVNVDLNVKVRANLDLVLVNPSYVFAAPVLGGQLAVGMMGIVGHNNSSLDGTITGGVGPFSATRPGSFDSSLLSRASPAIGPQIGYLFPVGNMQGYLNLKGYKEFDASDRPDGWNLWPTFAISLAAPAAAVRTPSKLVCK